VELVQIRDLTRCSIERNAYRALVGLPSGLLPSVPPNKFSVSHIEYKFLFVYFKHNQTVLFQVPLHSGTLLKLRDTKQSVPIKRKLPILVTARSKAWVWGLSLTGISGSNPTGGIGFCCQKSLRRADPSSRGVLRSVWCVLECDQVQH
jgi:hypothetical protein